MIPMEGFDKVDYIVLNKDSPHFGKSQAELKKVCEDKIREWRRDCKLKSKIEAGELKKGLYFKEKLDEFMKLKNLMHRNTANAAQERERRVIKERKAKAEREKKAA